MKRNQYTIMKFDPVDGSERPYPPNAHDYRQWHGDVAWLFNPWSGEKRHPGDIGTDVRGLLILPEGEPLFAASQPSAASGRELPPLPEPTEQFIEELVPLSELFKLDLTDMHTKLIERIDYWMLKALKLQKEGTVPVEPTKREMLIRKLQSMVDDPMWANHAEISKKTLEVIIAALTGAAPADANVGEKEIPERISTKWLRDIAQDSGFILNPLDWLVVPAPNADATPHLCNLLKLLKIQIRGGVELADCQNCGSQVVVDVGRVTTAREPSAPADKEDAERYRWLRNNSANQFHSPIAVSQRRLSEGIRYIGPLMGSPLDAAIDAAIDRMRSESGKGGKL